MFEGILLEFEIEPGVCGEKIFQVDCSTYAEFAAVQSRIENELKARGITVHKCWRMPISKLNLDNVDQELEKVMKQAIFRATDGCGSKFGEYLELRRLWEKCRLLGEAPLP